MYSIWLTLQDPLLTDLKTDIETLARLTRGPVFDPHLTVLGDMDLPRVAVLELASTIRPAFQDVTAIVNGVGYGSTFFQSVFLELQLPDALFDLQRSMLKQLGLATKYPPHISLAYGVEERATIKPLMAEIEARYVPRKVAFEGLVVMASSRHVSTENWRILERMPLT